ncbi:SDR family NAD(P)-dependent oxidoreductase [Sinorhizobium meliloti]|nr:SDR family NAD(P)-dependent oxidoreductase [Sinorhizobium meliloti]
MVHFADASPNQAAILTGGAKNPGWPSPNVSRTTAAASSSETSTLQGFDEAQAGFTPAMKQLVDVADMVAVEAAFRNTVERLGRGHILVNNAGVNGPIANTWVYPVKERERVLVIDLAGVFYCCPRAIPHMIDCSGPRSGSQWPPAPQGTILLSGSGLIPRYAIEDKLHASARSGLQPKLL